MIVTLSGGLGNQLFQCAFGLSLSRARNEELFFDKGSFEHDTLRHYQLNEYGLQLQFAYPAAPYYDEPDLTYHPEIYQCAPGTTYRGYWQSEKYFWKKLIAPLFATPKGLPNAGCQEVMERILTYPNSCFVGVRRADYLWPERIHYHGVMPISYYIEAERRMPHDAKYFVFTDDVPWVKRNFREDHEIVDVNGPNEKGWDIWLMSLCKHAIISNSTFHFWGSWLSERVFPDGIRIAPKNWYACGIANEVVPDRWVKL